VVYYKQQILFYYVPTTREEETNISIWPRSFSFGAEMITALISSTAKGMNKWIRGLGS
jgi:hypothetical protein